MTLAISQKLQSEKDMMKLEYDHGLLQEAYNGLKEANRKIDHKKYTPKAKVNK